MPIKTLIECDCGQHDIVYPCQDCRCGDPRFNKSEKYAMRKHQSKSEKVKVKPNERT